MEKPYLVTYQKKKKIENPTKIDNHSSIKLKFQSLIQKNQILDKMEKPQIRKPTPKNVPPNNKPKHTDLAFLHQESIYTVNSRFDDT